VCARGLIATGVKEVVRGGNIMRVEYSRTPAGDSGCSSTSILQISLSAVIIIIIISSSSSIGRSECVKTVIF